MKTIYIAGSKGSNTAINILKRHLESRGHRVTRDPKDPKGWDVTLRWGQSYEGKKPAINGKVNAFNKMEALEVFAKAGVYAPRVVTYTENLRGADYPVLARNIHHSKGKDIIVCQNEAEAKMAAPKRDFFTPWIPTETEFRVWVLNGKSFAAYEKQYKGEGEYEGFSRNRAMGFKFVKRDELLEARSPLTIFSEKAVKALGMEFGAVDVLLGKDGLYYVLEVNSMPHIDSMERSSGIRLAERISKWAEAQ